ncbi:MAG: hypothetical protein Q4D81_00925 [Eubacteriales bacterium]|nr:hypothetical protein [Eubacteriales bacterium]
MGEFQTVSAFFCVLAGFVLIALFLGAQERKRSREKLRKRLRSEFGRPSSKKTSRERYAQIPQYFRHHCKEAGFIEDGADGCREHDDGGPPADGRGKNFPAGGAGDRFSVDDITWNDLEMDRLFSRMDSTCSAAGEEYLYYLLRMPAMRAQALPFTQEQYAWLADETHEKARIRLQEILTSLGHAGRYSLYDYIDFTEELGERSNLPHYLAAVLPFLAFGLMFLHTGFGILTLLLVCCVNLVTYFREKAKIAPYFQVFAYILRLLDCAGMLEKEKCPVFREETERIPALLASFSSFRRGSSFLLGSLGGGSDPTGLVLEYVRILFHLDLIKFNSMLAQLRGRRAEIDALLTITGRIDACISIASWRKTLPYSAVPVLEEPSSGPVRAAGAEAAARTAFDAAELYHPLLASPVSNSIRAQKPVLLTGSNASGKSTFLKAAALCALLSQAVGIAPAKAYSGTYYRVYSSMALRDSLLDGESYFIVEIKSLRRILDASQAAACDNPVLCCIDEVLRGTNTVERIAASAEILRCFARTGTMCFAATHDLELTGLLEDVFDNYHFSEEITDGDVRFSYRLQTGPSTSCNAIALLGALGYEREIVDRARARADRFLSEGGWR